jgi:hypothetical protein
MDIHLVEHFDVSRRPGVPARRRVGKPARWFDCVIVDDSHGCIFVEVLSTTGEFHQLGLARKDVQRAATSGPRKMPERSIVL